MSLLSSEIIPAFTAKVFTVNSNSVTVYGPATMPASAESAMLPCRVISVYDTSDSVRRLTFGGNRVADWQIEDLLLIKDVALGLGPADIGADILTYRAAYAAFYRTLYGTERGWVATDCRITTAVTEWPASSGRFYDSVRAVVTVREILSN
jgi:hypothetical protein